MNLRSIILPVSQAKQRELRKRMAALGILEEDLDESFVRSSGPGGQKLQKTSTCVVLHHRPSGTRVKCQIGRTQGLNRYYARKILVEKLEERVRGIESERRRRIEKIKRQKRKRSKRAKEKVLAQKRRTAEKKRLRHRVIMDE